VQKPKLPLVTWVTGAGPIGLMFIMLVYFGGKATQLDLLPSASKKSFKGSRGV